MVVMEEAMEDMVVMEEAMVDMEVTVIQVATTEDWVMVVISADMGHK